MRMDDLKPGTTYYYTVGSMKANGTDDGTESTVKHFTTPGAPRSAKRGSRVMRIDVAFQPMWLYPGRPPDPRDRILTDVQRPC